MNLQASADAPFVLKAAATGLLVLHISGGTMGIASGWISILAQKGARLHRVAGTVFFISMLAMAGVGATVSPFLDEAQWTNTSAAVFTLYLIATSWMTVRRKPGEIGRFERIAVAVPLAQAALAAVLVAYGLATGRAAGFATVYAIGVLAALAAMTDLRMIRRGGLAGRDRVARHLWRMTFALFVATGSFFLGQPKFLPEFMRGTILPAIPPVGVLLLLAFWMLRTRFPRGFRAPASAQPVRS